jgi:branched-chain amino acid transport system substrate-binding protein
MEDRYRVKSTIAGFLAVGLLVAGCSSDSKSNASTTAAPTTTAAASSTTVGLTGAPLKVGLLAPSPGLLGTLFQAQTRGVAFASTDIAAGGGVMNGPLTAERLEPSTSQTEKNLISPAVDAGTSLFVGPAGSSSAIEALPELQRTKATACSASATNPTLTAGQKDMALFRTALPDDVFVTFLTGFLAQRQKDAKATGWKVAIVARADAYGQSVGNTLAAYLKAAGLDPVVFPYNPHQVVFDSLATQVAAAKPAQTVLVTYEEGANLAAALLKVKIDPKTMIGLDAFFAPRIASQATVGQPAAADGFTIVGTSGDKAFIDRLIADDPNGQVAYAAQAYDCTIVLALASAEVESKKASTIASAIQQVTAGGTVCTTYADCLSKMTAGEDIDYNGPSGNIAIDAHGDPTAARFTIAELRDGQITGISNSDIDIKDIARIQEAWASANFTTQLQQALRFLGFYSGPINGVWNTETSDALKAFQASVGLPATGVYDAATDAALRKALGQYGDLMNSSVKDIQQMLTDLGFYTGPIDGIWTNEVTAAVKALQKDLGVPQTGVIDAATLRAAYEKGLASVPPTTTSPPTTAGPTTTAPAPTTTRPPATTTTPPVTTTTTPAPTTTRPAGTTTTIPWASTTTLPPDQQESLWLTLKSRPEFSDLVTLIEDAGLTPELETVEIYTIFAPTNDALEKVDPATLEKLKADPEALMGLLAYHIVEGKVAYKDLKADAQIPTISGADLKVTGVSPDIKVNDSTITEPDIPATNGVIHGIDTVFTLPFTPLSSK